MKYLKVTAGIFLMLAASRFIPHPPNFTSLIALSFYVPALFGIRYIPALIVCFMITDFIIGFHGVTFFTWGSVVFIGLLSKFFTRTIFTRISGSLLGALLFFIITNFGVWSSGMYGYSLESFFNCYLLAIPFFSYTLLSTIVFSSLIEAVYNLYKTKFIKA